MCNAVARVSVITLALVMLSLAGCGSSSGGTWVGLQAPETAAVFPGDSSHGISLTAPSDNPADTLIGYLALGIEELDGQLKAQVVAASAFQADRVVFELQYDAGEYTPLVAQATDAFAASAERLSLHLLDNPGVVACGVVPFDGNSRSVAAGSVLVEVLFSLEPFDEGRAAAAVPAHTYALSPLTWDTHDQQFVWYYVNTGDFDQNGLVGISDLVPLGRLIGTVGPFDFDNSLSLVDNDGDGRITVADMEAIRFFYGNLIQSYNFYCSDLIDDIPETYDDISSLDPLASFELSTAEGDSILERRWFEYRPETVSSTSFYWVRPQAVSGTTVEEGTRSNLAVPGQIEENGGTILSGDGFNLPPTAAMNLSYTGDSVPLEVEFDAGGSEDPDGMIITYEWDFNGDGLFDTYGNGPEATHTFTRAGTYEPLVRVTDNNGAWASFRAPAFTVNEATVTNMAPLADIAATTTGGEVPLTVGLLANGSRDYDGYITSYEWDFDGDGTFDLDSGTDSTVLHEYTVAGTWTATVRVTDSYGDTATDSVVVTATDPPQPNITPTPNVTADTTAGDAPLPVSFDASASDDPDGYIVKYYWDYDGDGTFDKISFEPFASTVYYDPGIYDVALAMEDDGGSYVTTHLAISVNLVENVLPVAGFTPSATAGLAPLAVHFDGSTSTDGDGSLVRYDWDFDGDGIWDAYDAPDTVDWTFTKAGNFDARLRVTDNVGAQDDAVVTITVNLPGNIPPVADLLGSPLSGLTPLVVSFDATGSSDSDGSIVRYDYDFNGDGIWDAYDGPGTAAWTYTTAGTFNATLRVTDDDGAQHTDVLVVTPSAPVNDLPVAQISASANSGLVPFTVNFDASASTDSDGSITRYDYDFDGDGIWDAYDAQSTVTWTYLAAGSFGARVRVTDDLGGQASATETIIVNVPGNDPPLADIQADVTSGIYPLLVNFDATGSTDPEGPIARYDWDLNGDGNYEYYDASPSTSWTYTTSGTYDATVRVTDSEGVQDTATETITVNAPGNTAPTASLTATPDSGNVPLTVTLDASGSSDPDAGDSVASYEWDFNGDGNYEVLTYSDTYVYEYIAGGSYTPTVRVRDTHGVADTASDSVTVIVPGNTAPNASLTATPTSGDIPLEVTLDASGSNDPDPGDSIAAYEWDFNGDGTFDAVTFTPSYVYTYTTGGTYDAVVRVTDTNGGTDTATAGVSANVPGNNPPVADLTATPDNGNAPLTVTLDASGSVESDPGDSISGYEWDFNGDGTYDAFSLASSQIHEYTSGGTYDAVVRVTDSYGVSDTALVTVTVNVIGNNPPVASLNATPTAGSAPLEVTFDASASSDPDMGDGIASYEWDFNGDGNYDALTYTPTYVYTYNSGGAFDAKVRVKDSYGASDTAVQTINVTSGGNNAPVADLQGTPDSGAAPLAVTLDASASADPDTGDSIVSYEWDFEGDGYYDVVTYTSIYVYTYQNGGTFNATVRVRDNYNVTDTASKTITVTGGGSGGTDPVADITATVNLGYVPLQVTFDASASTDDGTIELYEWDFNGDGAYDSYGANASVSGTYYTAGVYGATVRVTDDSGATDTAEVTVSVLDTVWATFGHDSLHTRRSTATGPQTSNIRWSYATGATINASATIGRDGTILVGSLDNYLYAINPNGTFKWAYLTGNQVRSTPAVGPDGAIYFGSYDNNVYCLNSDGTLRWFFPTSNSVAASPVIGKNGVVYVGSLDTDFYAINPDGTEKWHYSSTTAVYSSAAVGADGTVYVGLGIYLYAFNPDDGSYYWRYNTGGNLTSSPAVATDGTIYIGSNIGKLFAINPDGSNYWDATMGSIVSSSPAIGADGSIYVGCTNDRLYAYDPDGTPQWNYNMGTDLAASPAVGGDGTIYIGTQGGLFYAMNPNGTVLWTAVGLGSMVNASPIISGDGTLYVGTYDNSLYAFGP